MEESAGELSLGEGRERSESSEVSGEGAAWDGPNLGQDPSAQTSPRPRAQSRIAPTLDASTQPSCSSLQSLWRLRRLPQMPKYSTFTAPLPGRFGAPRPVAVQVLSMSPTPAPTSHSQASRTPSGPSALCLPQSGHLPQGTVTMPGRSGPWTGTSARLWSRRLRGGQVQSTAGSES